MWNDWHPKNTSVITVWDVSCLLFLCVHLCHQIAACGKPLHHWAQTLIRTVCFLKFDWSLSGQQNEDIFQILQGECGLPAPADMNQIVTQMVAFDSRNYLVSLDTAAKPFLTFFNSTVKLLASIFWGKKIISFREVCPTPWYTHHALIKAYQRLII